MKYHYLISCLRCKKGETMYWNTCVGTDRKLKTGKDIDQLSDFLLKEYGGAVTIVSLNLLSRSLF